MSFGSVLIWDSFQPVSLAVNLIQLNKLGDSLPDEQIFFISTFEDGTNGTFSLRSVCCVDIY
jgi:hypothetical protein